MSHRFNVVASYFQVIVADEATEDDFSQLWTDDALRTMLAAGESALVVGTLRNVSVPVELHILEQRPEIAADDVDHLAEGSLAIPSGTLVVVNCEEPWAGAPRIAVAPGRYQALFTASGIGTIQDEWSPADDIYRVYLWPGARVPTRLIKHWRRDA